jgi:hypothetical protein
MTILTLAQELRGEQQKLVPDGLLKKINVD